MSLLNWLLRCLCLKHFKNQFSLLNMPCCTRTGLTFYKTKIMLPQRIYLKQKQIMTSSKQMSYFTYECRWTSILSGFAAIWTSWHSHQTNHIKWWLSGARPQVTQLRTRLAATPSIKQASVEPHKHPLATEITRQCWNKDTKGKASFSVALKKMFSPDVDLWLHAPLSQPGFSECKWAEQLVTPSLEWKETLHCCEPSWSSTYEWWMTLLCGVLVSYSQYKRPWLVHNYSWNHTWCARVHF